MSGAALTVAGINKSFFGVPVLHDVSLELYAGRTLGLVGQNGAGKSTLMNVIGGNLAPDSGSMRLGAAPYAPANAREAAERGVAFIHQELNLFSNLSIAENIFIAAMPRGSARMIDRVALRARTTDLLHEVGLDLSPDTLVERLSPGERQLVEVTKAIQLDADIVIFDEPTTSLTPRETARLFGLIGRLKAVGKAVVYISHVLADIEALSDDVAVLRDGRLVAHGPRAEFPARRMIGLMLGRDIEQLYPPRRNAVRDEVLLEARGVSLRGVVKNIGFALRAGEIVGLFGLMGSGRTELARLLFGLDRFHHGELVLGGRRIKEITPRGAIGARMAFITENRREEGLMMNAAIADNIALASLRQAGGRLGLLDKADVAAAAARLAASLQIRCGDVETQAARSLSGGNQQKVVIAKWLMAAPKIFLLDEPTRGIDVAAKFEIYSIVDDLVAGGSGVLLISSEIEEAMAMADRILVMNRGEISGEFAREEFDKETILRAAFGEGEKAA